jgi:hypothetical protein
VNVIGDMLLFADDGSATCAANTEMVVNFPQFFEKELKKNGSSGKCRGKHGPQVRSAS